MSQLTNSLKLIQLLRKNGAMQSIDLAKEIGCTQRMIREYVRTINKETDIQIRSKAGAKGGYCIEDVILNDNEQLALYEAAKFLKENRFKYVNNFENAYVKIKCKFPELE